MINNLRVDRIIHRCIQNFNLDLDNLVVLTEAASGAYLYTPILAALAGARKVYAVTRDSRYGKKQDIKNQTLNEAKQKGVEAKIEVIFKKTAALVEECDIITNTGFVRPIDRKMISWMKPTAVIPLMWEPWEIREGEIDFRACRDHGILVMGTDEEKKPLDMYQYAGFIAMKMLFELRLEGCKTNVILLGGKESLGGSINRHFKNVGINVSWFTKDGELQSRPYSEFAEFFKFHGAEFDALIIAEHSEPLPLFGRNALLDYDEIKTINPSLCIGIIAGNIDIEGLKTSGIHFFPEIVLPFGYMSYQPYHLGPLPVIELYTAGLKVGEAMARARLAGKGIEETREYALDLSNAMPVTD